MSRLPLPVSLRIAARYRDNTFRCFSACKLWTDPVASAVAERLLPTDLPLIDIGCGIGQFTFYLRERGYTAPIFAVDTEVKKIEAAQAVATAHYPDTTFAVMSAADPAALTPTNQQPGHIVMLDVLHYLDPEHQMRVLHDLAQAVAPGAWVILRATPRDESWRFRVSLAEERMIEKVKWVSAVPVYYPTRDEIAGPFAERGFTCDIRPLWGLTPFNSYFFAFRKPR